MTDVHATSYGPHPDHALISWRAVLAGAVVAIAVGAMLNLLGVALGAASLNPFDLSRADAGEFSALAGIWVALANLIGLFIGGFVASRAARFADHHRGLLVGLAVWALAFLFAILIAGATTAGGLTSVMNGVAERAEFSELAPPPALIEGETPTSERAAAVPPPVQPLAEETADATGALALWAFLTMLLGAVGAVFGARYGATRHGWELKADLAGDTGPHVGGRSRTTSTV